MSAAWGVDWRKPPLKQLIDDYKFTAVKQAVEPLGRLLDHSLPSLDGVTVCEVPTAAGHIRQLGYDHAKLLAKNLARRRRLDYQPLLTRSGQQTQHFSSRHARQVQAKRLFTATMAVNGKVLLIDDIVTTGSSLRAAARVLRKAGADEVYAGILVRQPLD